MEPTTLVTTPRNKTSASQYPTSSWGYLYQQAQKHSRMNLRRGRKHPAKQPRTLTTEKPLVPYWRPRQCPSMPFAQRLLQRNLNRSAVQHLRRSVRQFLEVVMKSCRRSTVRHPLLRKSRLEASLNDVTRQLQNAPGEGLFLIQTRKKL